MNRPTNCNGRSLIFDDTSARLHNSPIRLLVLRRHPVGVCRFHFGTSRYLCLLPMTTAQLGSLLRLVRLSLFWAHCLSGQPLLLQLQLLHRKVTVR